MLHQIKKASLGICSAFILSSCIESPLINSGKAADTIYYGGTIITVDDSAPIAEAVAVRNGRIIAVGDVADMVPHGRPDTTLIDLDGNTMLPGFIDAHSHVSNVGFQSVAVNLLPAPDGDVNDLSALKNKLRAWVDSSPALLEKSGWIIGFGYDDSQLASKKHPTADDLDDVSTDYPILIIHQSGHLGSLNHKALELLGYTKGVENPHDGKLRREEDGVTPNGVIEESPVLDIIGSITSNLDIGFMQNLLKEGVDVYSKNGFTTVQEGKASFLVGFLYSLSTLVQSYPIDVNAYIDIQGANPLLTPKAWDTTYFNGFRVAGHKITIDGSPQGKTAWLTKHYHVAPDGEDDDYAGYPALEMKTLYDGVMDGYKHNVQVIAHANGDAAIDKLIDAVKTAQQRYGKKDLRPVLIHGQTLRQDQITDLATLGIIPSLFPLHTFYWGDWHYDSVLGPKRAEFISPTRACLDAGLIVTTHTDAPVVMPDALRMISATVRRITRSGRILGEDQRLTPYEAIETTTLSAAYQYFEEDRKGSIEVDKLADFVVLSDNPLTVPEDRIASIRVLETIKEDRRVYTTHSLTSEIMIDLIDTPRGEELLEEYGLNQ